MGKGTFDNRSNDGWAVALPWTGPRSFEPTRLSAIRSFLRDVGDSDALGNETYLTGRETIAWKRWKRKGAMAVHVELRISDYRWEE